ncbi:MAG: bifunctional metallophosphatase/5'-nucleotidase [Planctomycetota bacterium]
MIRRKRSSLRLELLEQRQLLAADFTLELLHIADQEGGVSAIQDAPRLSAVLNSLRQEDLGGDNQPDNTLTLSSGDAFIPGLFFGASEEAFGSEGIADIQIQNELGIQAIALGNHEFDFGTGTLAGLIDGSAPGDVFGTDFAGTDFPYLSGNLDFSSDANLAGLAVGGGSAPLPGTVTSSVVLTVGGESIGVVGATTPTLASISSPGDVGIAPSPFDSSPTSEQLDALAGVIQTDVDALITANPSVDKVILLAHMQQLDIELALASRLSNVDVIVAGGSNTRLTDANDRLRVGDSNQGSYPQFVENLDGQSTAVVNTDGSYKYVGRLVIGFDADGNLLPETYDPIVSGAYATDDQGVADLDAAGLVDPEVQAIVDAIEAEIIATESNVFGVSSEFLNGNRSGTGEAGDPDGVRTQETNLGNLTADANLAEAQKADETVQVALKNGGGIRASIGQVLVPAGGDQPVRLPNEAVIDSEGNVIKPEGGISQNDIQTTLAFNNGLTLMTLTGEELVGLLEHGVSSIPGVSGRFAQIAGMTFSYNPELPVGERVVNAAITDDDGNLVAPLVRGGRIVAANELFRLVTLDFLARPRFDEEGTFVGGGDGYPFPNTNTDPEAGELGDPDIVARVNLVQLEQEGQQTGDAVFADDGTEQDALAEYLSDQFATPETAFAEADRGPIVDKRIQDVLVRADTIFPVSGRVRVTSEGDNGPGSFRQAIQIADENPGVNRIIFDSRVDLVELESPVEYLGEQKLTISGSSVVLRASDTFDGDGVFISRAAADLFFSRLTVDGDFDEGESPAAGIFIPVPGDATGTIEIGLDRVTIVNNGQHGLHIADQSANSDASISLTMSRSDVINNGIGELDFDGVRVDEGGAGDLIASIRSSHFDGNGGDGLELDERGVGSVIASVRQTSFDENGFFDEDFDPEDPANPRDEQDLDDGFDIDEAGEGGIIASVLHSQANNNFDEGFDFDEEDDGDIVMRFIRVEANENSDEGIKAGEEDEGGISGFFSRVDMIGNGDDDKAVEASGGEGMDLGEEDGGSVFVRLIRVVANENGAEGIKIEEEGDGGLDSFLVRVTAESNAETGIKVEESDAGNLFAWVSRVEANDNGEDGLEIAESGTGSAFATAVRSEFNGNRDFGLRVTQEDVGGGRLLLSRSGADENGDGALLAEGVEVLGDLDD